MPFDNLTLVGKVALITGSGRENGIGAGIARALARNGAAVAIHYVSDASKSRAEQVAADLARDYNVKTVVVQGGIQTYESAKSIVEQIQKGLGIDCIDILVNNGAVSQHTSLLDVGQEQLEHEFSVNVFGLIYMIQAVVKAGKMPSGGRIVNIGSIGSKMLSAIPVYSTAKAASDALTTLFAGELGKTHGITVNTIAPGPVPTDLSTAYLLGADGNPTSAAQSFFAQTRAADRLGAVEDIADATLLLVSEKSRWITAQYISVSGGVTGTM